MQWKQLITEDWQRKLVALLLAIIIWYAVSSQLQQTRNVTVPVTFKIEEPDVRLVDPDNLPLVSITLRGSSRNLDQVTSNNVQVQHMIEKWQGTGAYEAFILERDVRDLPHGVHVLDITPNKVTIPLDRVIQKPLTVVPTFSGELRPGWERRLTTVVPPTVEVRGLRRELRNLETIPTEPIPLGGDIPSRFEIDRRVRPPVDTIEIVGARDSVVVTVELRYTLVEKPLSGLNLEVLDQRGSPFFVESIRMPQYEDPGVKVVIEGPTEAIDQLSNATDYVRAFVDVSGVRQPGEYTLPVRIWLNARGCRVREQSIQPANVPVVIARRAEPPPAAPAPEPGSEAPAGNGAAPAPQP